MLNSLALSYQALGQWEQADEALTSGIGLIESYTPSQEAALRSQLLVKARLLMTAGRSHLAVGQPTEALEIWQQAAEFYERAEDAVGLSRAQINQAQALRELGFYRRALDQLRAIAESIESQPDWPPNSLLKAIALRRLGEALLLSGYLSEAESALGKSLAIFEQNYEVDEISATLLSLGHTARRLGDLERAQALYAQALGAIAPNQMQDNARTDISNASVDSRTAAPKQVSIVKQVSIELAQLDLAIQAGDTSTITHLWPTLQQQFSDLPNSRKTFYQQIQWATSLIKLLTLANNDQSKLLFSEADLPSLQTIDWQLREITIQSRLLSDRRAESYALGTLGHLHEFNHQWESAQKLTQRALALSQAENATDITYQWQWQLGRLWRNAQNPAQSTTNAVSAYTQAIDTLSILRGDLSATEGSTQFSFKENVEPIYRQLVSLLLQTQPDEADYQQNLMAAQNVIESLRLAELDNYFQEACLDVSPIDINQVDESAAIIYTLVLEDRLSVILHLPNQPAQHFSVAVSDEEVSEVAAQLRAQLVVRSRRQYLDSAARLYDWLIAPMRTVLEQSQIETLVFVLDGPLQNIPMATLYNGEHFLIEDFGIALTPGLTLLNPQPWNSRRLSALIAGVSESRQGLSALPYVAKEIEKVIASISSYTVLLDQDFTQDALARQLRSKLYPIVHVATHGQFGSTAEETFLLAWDSLINVRDVSQMLQANLGGREGIDLLMLSACETASGDQQAALGLAGVAIRAGARSTVGSLWSVNDEATAQFVGYFYQQLTQPGTSRATALRAAQLQLIQDPQYRHPIYWAPYILLGSWL